MTDHANLEISRGGYEAFASGDLATVGDLFSDDIVWHSGGNNILTGDYEGKEAVLGFFGRLMQETEGSFKNDIHDMLANDEHGVALVTASATRGGKSFEGRVVHVFHMSDEKMTEFWSFPEDQSLFDEFWA
ncbi:MAG: nuclear transport factor 2 family protein [Acidimicrobiia bacterium]|nr:nuclear transport factor 2 family protein [Acidimicrobiia bacterium]